MSKGVAVTVAVVVAVLLLAYIIFMLEAYKRSFWIFQPYVPTPPETNTCYPLIKVIPFSNKDQYTTLQNNVNRANGSTSANAS